MPEPGVRATSQELIEELMCAAVALIEAVIDRIADDPCAAAELAGAAESRPC